MAPSQHLLLVCSLLFFTVPSISKTSSRPKALVLPVTKDSKTLQYLVQIHQRTPIVPVKLTLDVSGEYLWVDCEKGYGSSTYKPVPCKSSKCSLDGTNYCREKCYSTPRIGCHNNTCGASPLNMIARIVSLTDFSQDILTIRSTDGSNPGKVVPVNDFAFACGFPDLLQGLASGVTGMAGLGWNMASIPWQLSAAFSFRKRFAMCLSSSTNAKGVIIFGDGQYNLLPGIDVSKSLINTPLIKQKKSFEDFAYFIGVKSIQINGKKVALNQTLLSIDEEGKGGTKISTIDPYTIMESSIYKAVSEAFAEALSGVPRAPSVAPFSLCFDSKNIRSTGVGPAVPHIDLVLQSSSVVWRISGANSMVQAAKNILCLGFVDKGVLNADISANIRNAIVIGGHQLEDNLIQVDIAASKLGFSSSLLFTKTSCSNFNFTPKA